MAEQANEGPEPRRRGVGFPGLPLRESVDVIVTIGQHGVTHSHDAVAAYLGHSTANSGAFRSKLAAMRDWGLIERGDKDRVTLSDLAQQLVMEAPDHNDAHELLVRAFESCRVFGVLYEDSAKQTPLEAQRIRTTVVVRHGVATEQADKFVDSFVESVVYAGLGQLEGGKLTLLSRDTAFKRGERDPELPQLVSGEYFKPSTTDQPGTVQTPPIALRQAWPIDGGEIVFTIRTVHALPPSIWEHVAKMAQVAEGMESLLTGPAFEVRTGVKLPAAYGGGGVAADPGDNG